VPTLRPEQLDSIIASGRLEPLYVFDGPENWLKERVVEKIIAKCVPPEARDFNLSRIDGKSASAGDVVNSAQSLPFLSDKRVVIVSSAEEFSAADQRTIGECLGDLPKSTCLVFLYQGKANLREEIPAMAVSHGNIVTFWTPFESQLPAWITAEAKRRGKGIAWDAARQLAEACADLQEISNELDKLVLYVGGKPSIALADVLEQGLPEASGDYRDLEEAIWSRRFPDALEQGHLLSNAGISAEGIFPVFERVFRTLYLGHYYMKVKKWTLADTQNALGMRGKMQQANFTKGLEMYRPREVEQGLGHIAQADYELKTGVLPSRLALGLLTLKLVRA
jgi:DNA polymerase-3 subunit delta